MSKQKSSTASYAQRWEDLRPTIIDAYLGLNNFDKPKTLSQLELFMKETHSFYAVIHQYQTKFREWGISKRTTKKQKNDMTIVLGKRNREGASTSDVLILMGEDNEVTTRVDKKQMTRYLKGCMRREINTFLAPGVFSRWNLPYLAYKNSLRGVPPNHASPFAGSAPTPEYLNVHSPQAPSPEAGPSATTPTALLIHQKSFRDRSVLLMKGSGIELLSSVNERDRSVLSGWLHDYWIHSFVTAKHWGRGPLEWTASQIAEMTLGGINVDGQSTTKI
ncbi:hypothetical protein Cob_v010834 [Colletotrichum orbiculare MAFF 240422]|uniref:Clr5 domain-containing protein n=1 Tax=Colletotrichum orbiculare (strain 104-T / ATCC 96160 / CBS 514.97 / LARS 414 / MAFF 240422) TaxID=1213857 RepID=A0A484FD02_COLOR|nr:hypothetical protein Cob_v010834 [Colletotrichum orbiculare MAFF 240422]